MKKTLLATFVFLLGSTAFGQVAEFGVSGGVSRLNNGGLGTEGVDPTSAEYKLKSGFRLGFRATLNNWRFFGHEFGYAYNRSQLNYAGVSEQGMAIHQGFYNMLAYATPEGTRVRPFVAGGGHFSNFTPPGSSAQYGGGVNKPGFNYGGGVKFRVSEMFGVRFDFRQYLTGRPFDLPNAPSGLLKQNEISMGFALWL
jgi:hypothetical protein